MTKEEEDQRRLCRILFSARLMAESGMALPDGSEVVRIIPSEDCVEWGSRGDHWIFVRNKSLEVVKKGEAVPTVSVRVEVSERDLGGDTIMTQKKVVFVKHGGFGNIP